MGKQVFISHSSKDATFVKRFYEFLCNIGVDSDDIFCTSVDGNGMSNGQRIEKVIREKINDSNLIIYIFSKDFLESPYCLEELGAGWVNSGNPERKMYIVKLNNFADSNLKGFVGGDFYYSDVTNGIDDLSDDILEYLGLPNLKMARYNNIKNDFLESIKTIIQKHNTKYDFNKVSVKSNQLTDTKQLVLSKLSGRELLLLKFIIDTDISVFEMYQYDLNLGDYVESSAFDEIKNWECDNGLNDSLSKNLTKITSKYEIRKWLEIISYDEDLALEYKITEILLHMIDNLTEDELDLLDKNMQSFILDELPF